MADLNNVIISGTNADNMPRGSVAQRPSTPEVGMIRFNTDFNEVEYYNGSNWINPNTGAKAGIGETAATAARDARAIKNARPDAGDGVYWIDLPVVGPRQIYCLMDKRYDGGAWMMVMKATRGNTFEYASSYWTTRNTLNENDLDRGDSDAKFETFNRFEGRDLMATWPDLPGGGGSIPAGDEHVWLQNGFYGDRINLVDFFNSVSIWFIGDARLYPGWSGSNFNFSSQVDIRFYGFNWNGAYDTRWGFGWNENGGGLFPFGNQGSDDVGGGIGFGGRRGTRYSAGDVISCCENVAGFNRSARVEMWIR